MFFHVCKILWQRYSKSIGDNWLLKKVLGRYERCILQCVTPWTFWQKSEPLDTGGNVDQKQQKKLLFWGFGWTCLFKLPLFLNELSYRYQIGLKLKLIYSIFKIYNEENFFWQTTTFGMKKICFLIKIWIKSWFIVHAIL